MGALLQDGFLFHHSVRPRTVITETEKAALSADLLRGRAGDECRAVAKCGLLSATQSVQRRGTVAFRRTDAGVDDEEEVHPSRSSFCFWVVLEVFSAFITRMLPMEVCPPDICACNQRQSAAEMHSERDMRYKTPGMTLWR